MVGLHFIHDLNIVHLDIKPYNILFSQKVIFVIGIREVNQKENLWNLSELGLWVENNRLRAGPGAGCGGAGGHREAAGHHRVHVPGGDELQAGGHQRRPVERRRGQLHAAHRRQVALLRWLQVNTDYTVTRVPQFLHTFGKYHGFPGGSEYNTRSPGV